MCNCENGNFCGYHAREQREIQEILQEAWGHDNADYDPGFDISTNGFLADLAIVGPIPPKSELN